mmetsp:Transcript_27795/g.85259  ORF Transcript_27795/g.85259 Transcript_27795/m.85259 type:complete len:231 (+) Transcript_27795:369-1061(+)
MRGNERNVHWPICCLLVVEIVPIAGQRNLVSNSVLFRIRVHESVFDQSVLCLCSFDGLIDVELVKLIVIKCGITPALHGDDLRIGDHGRRSIARQALSHLDRLETMQVRRQRPIVVAFPDATVAMQLLIPIKNSVVPSRRRCAVPPLNSGVDAGTKVLGGPLRLEVQVRHKGTLRACIGVIDASVDVLQAGGVEVTRSQCFGCSKPQTPAPTNTGSFEDATTGCPSGQPA